MKLKNNNGITLIALVITIIVLLILAGVSINMINGNDGIISKARNAAEKTKTNSSDEEQKLKDTSAYIDEKSNSLNNTNEPDFSDLLEIEGCPLKFGRAYINNDTGTYIGLLPFTDGGALVGWPGFGWVTDNVEYLPAGSLTYDGCNIIFDGSTIATCNSEGTEVYYDGMTFTFEYLLLGTNDCCSHTISRNDAKHYVATYIVGETEMLTGDTYCVYCKELLKSGYCNHIHTELQNIMQATCTKNGYTGDTKCLDCEKIINNGNIITALSHKDINRDLQCDTCNESIDGLISSNGVQLISWENLVNTYGLNITTSYNDANNVKSNSSSLYNIINNNINLSDGTKLIINEEIENIGSYAFYGCESIETIIIPNNITNIAEGTFYNCSSLKTVNINTNITSIGNYAFYNCKAIQSLIIPDSVKSIGNYAFYNCKAIQSLIIPDSVKSIGTWAFANSGIQDITIPANIITLEEYTFYNCNNIKNIIIPNNIESVGRDLFANCSKLETVKFEENSKLSNISYNMFSNCTNLKTITIPDSIKTWGNWAFRNCDSITSIGLYGSNADVKIPNRLTELPAAFYGCDNLKTIVLPESITHISANNFAYNPNLESIYIPINITEISSSAFDKCPSLSTVYYAGTQEQWKAITIENSYGGNNALVNANIYYNYTGN